MTSDPSQHNDTADYSLADALLSRSETDTLIQSRSETVPPPPGTGAETTASDDDYLDFDTHKRNRVTTGLVVCLIFALGVLTGALVALTFAPSQPPATVYVLSETASPSAPSTTGPR